ncbi:DNA sulfur modification protein DndE [Alienimonas californiensis]|uniref:DNA sulfur modification protein DndE n=1 Tax=Alienimonas californiensis TaxID=2527989 RepID=UPI001A97DA18|nr:DNA sulfur modification protein DndE [Alienimonas californiensis]
MSAPIVETVRLSRTARDQMLSLKRRTGIEGWNVLSRWALCVSLAEPTRPRDPGPAGDGGIEMTWRTFAGGDADLYAALIRQRCTADGLAADDATAVVQEFHRHLHRGVAYLVGERDLASVSQLVSKSLA